MNKTIKSGENIFNTKGNTMSSKGLKIPVEEISQEGDDEDEDLITTLKPSR